MTTATFGEEMRHEWECRDCEVRVRDMNGAPIPEPRKWEASRCPHCRIAHVRDTAGNKPAEKLEERLLRRRRKSPMRSKTASATEPSKDAEKRREQVREICEQHPEWNAEQIGEAVGVASRTASRIRQELGLKRQNGGLPAETRERIEAALREATKPDADIAKELSVDYGAVAKTRQGMGLPNFKERLKAERRERIRELLADHPEWTNEQLADAMGEYRSTVMRDRKALGLSRKSSPAVRATP